MKNLQVEVKPDPVTWKWLNMSANPSKRLLLGGYNYSMTVTFKHPLILDIWI